MKPLHAILSAVVAIALWTGGTPSGSACDVPVFRYALELWPPDHFPVYLFHRGELDEESRELVDRLRAAERANAINLRLTPVDVEGDPGPEDLEVWESLGDRELARPSLVIRTPARLGPATSIIALDLTREHVDQLLDSPAREEIGRRIIDGHSVVWVLLEGGDGPRDDLAFASLTSQLARLEGVLELPEPSAEDLLSADAEPLKLSFSAIRLRRDDPAERAFVAVLLNVEPDLKDAEFDGEPMVFPVFGRGRALYALVGDGIVPGTIEEAARYLTGACQCTVKAENPGADLLMAVDWDRQVTPTLAHDAAPPPLGGLASFAEPIDEPTGPEPSPVAGDRDDPEEAETVPTGPLARQGSAATDSAELAGGPPVSPVSSAAPGGRRPAVSALLIVSALGIMALLAGVVLTRRES